MHNSDRTAADTPLIAARFEAALAHRTWSFPDAGRNARSSLFLLRAGRGVLTRSHCAAVPLSAPSLLWLPGSAVATFQVLAGGDGFTASASADLVQRTAAEAVLPDALRPLLDQPVVAGPERLGASLPALAASFDALVEESQQQLPGASAMIELHFDLLLVQLWRASGPHPSGGMRRGSASTVQRFRRLVELHYRDGLVIDGFAARLGVTRAHLHASCLRATGRTPLALVHERLVAEAQVRLEQTDLSIEQVGYGIGFRDPGYFNRFFKRLTGQSPGSYRRDATMAQAKQGAPSFAAWP